MIAVDMSNTLYSSIIKSLKESNNNAAIAKNQVFITLLSYKKNFYKQWGAPVLAFDTKNGYWRKDVFEHYKHGREAARSASDVDWELVSKLATELTDGIIENMPWKCIRVDKAEADDIIGVLGMEYGDEPMLIMSSDKDYKQLHGKRGVKQYSSIMKKWITTDDPVKSLYELILEGDTGDAIPNLFSPVDSFVNHIRQSPITPKRRKEFFDDIEAAKVERKERFDLNQQLVDFNFIPQDIRDLILKSYETPVRGSINKLYKYFVANRMSGLLSNIEMFKVKEGDYSVRTEISFFG